MDIQNDTQLAEAVVRMAGEIPETDHAQLSEAVYKYLGQGTWNVFTQPESYVLVLCMSADRVEIIGD